MDASSLCVHFLIKHWLCCRLDLVDFKWNHLSDYNDDVDDNKQIVSDRNLNSNGNRFQKGLVSVRSNPAFVRTQKKNSKKKIQKKKKKKKKN
jgi:hypothetical protein